jgi:hypothetical protein
MNPGIQNFIATTHSWKAGVGIIHGGPPSRAMINDERQCEVVPDHTRQE